MLCVTTDRYVSKESAAITNSRCARAASRSFSNSACSLRCGNPVLGLIQLLYKTLARIVAPQRGQVIPIAPLVRRQRLLLLRILPNLPCQVVQRRFSIDQRPNLLFELWRVLADGDEKLAAVVNVFNCCWMGDVEL